MMLNFMVTDTDEVAGRRCQEKWGREAANPANREGEEGYKSNNHLHHNCV